MLDQIEKEVPNKNVTSIDTELLIIGGGAAGCTAAIKAREMNVDALVVDKGFVSRTGCSSFTGGMFSCFSPELGHKFEEWMEYFVRSAEYINNRDWVEIQLNETRNRAAELKAMGVTFVEKDGKIFESRFMPGIPVTHFMISDSRNLMVLVRRKVLEVGAKILDKVIITDLIKSEGKIVGAVGAHVSEGDFYVIKAKAVICAGGPTFYNPEGTPHAFCTGDTLAMAYRAGAEIISRELGVYSSRFPRACPGAHNIGKYLSETPPKYVNAEGREFAKDYVFKSMTGAPHMMSTWFSEVHAGRAPIYFDQGDPGSKQKKFVRSHAESAAGGFLFERAGIRLDGKYESLVFSGLIGGTGGSSGLRVDTTGASTIPGLFGAGDNAGTNLWGAARPTVGHAITHAFVTGHRVGQFAAEYTLNNKKTLVDEKEIIELARSVYTPLQRIGGFRPDYLKECVSNLMTPYYVCYMKDEERLKATLTLIEFLNNHIAPNLKSEDIHDLRNAHEGRNMALGAQMALMAAIERKESRGDYVREDYPTRNDPDMLMWVGEKMGADGNMEVFRIPIPQKWWPDLSKPYEERYYFKHIID